MWVVYKNAFLGGVGGAKGIVLHSLILLTGWIKIYHIVNHVYSYKIRFKAYRTIFCHMRFSRRRCITQDSHLQPMPYFRGYIQYKQWSSWKKNLILFPPFALPYPKNCIYFWIHLLILANFYPISDRLLKTIQKISFWLLERIQNFNATSCTEIWSCKVTHTKAK